MPAAALMGHPPPRPPTDLAMLAHDRHADSRPPRAPGSCRAGRGQALRFKTAAQPKDACTNQLTEAGHLVGPMAMPHRMPRCNVCQQHVQQGALAPPPLLPWHDPG